MATQRVTARHPGALASAPAPLAAPAVYALDFALTGGLDDLAPWLDRAAALGFDHVLLPVPFAATGTDALPLVRDHAALAPRAGAGEPEAALGRLAHECRERGLGLLMDLVLDRVAADGAVAAGAPEIFAPPDLAAIPDPRRPVEIGDAAIARLATREEAERAGTWWGERVRRWHGAGITGLRLLGLNRVPGVAAGPLIRAVRDACAGCALIGWTPGMAWSDFGALAGTGLDFVVPSLPWWDWHAEWLWEEMALLAGTTRLMACPEPPGGPRLAAEFHDPSLVERALRRALVTAAALAPAWLLPAGFEFGLAGHEGLPPSRPEALRMGARLDLSAEIAALNAARRRDESLTEDTLPRLLSGPGAPVVALLRVDAPDPRTAGCASLLVANADLVHRQKVAAAQLLAVTGGSFGRFTARLPAEAPPLLPGSELALAPGEVRLYAAGAARLLGASLPSQHETAAQAIAAPRIAIEDVQPRVEGGDFAVKRVLGEAVLVEADLLCDGHDKLGGALRWREPGTEEWQETRMRPLGNDRWQASFPLLRPGPHEFRVQAWRDAFASFRDELGKKHAAGVPTRLELEEGRALVAHAAETAPPGLLPQVRALLAALDAAGEDQRRQMLLDGEIAALMAEADDRPFSTESPPLSVQADRGAAQFASWYEIFPRSMSDDPDRHGTFDDVIRHLPRVRDMGFDVLYFPPVHPVGHTNRKGRNNALRAGPDDPGSPYAIGSEQGGHDAIEPRLGTLEDFKRLIEAAAEHGLEIALDFAIQCSPDHPWLRLHKDWFDWRPDGSLKYAENPPKKYEDIVNVDFYAPGARPDLWIALCNVVLFWAQQGVRIFRVDNPHTKPFPFWEWMIAEVQARHPDAIFLAEAFTRPKIMYRLAKLGFTQSYTYFTWRNSKRELTEYLTELTTTAPREFFRPNFFVNTPDINPVFLQGAGRAGFLIRAALAATLSGLWGAYSGFELCEATPIPGREEYLDSEKYQIRAWDWDRSGNIRREITELNRIRRRNPTLQTHLNVSFHNAFNDAILYYEKATPDRSNVLLVAVSMDPHAAQEADFEIPLWKWGLPDSAALAGEDLLTGAGFTWHGKVQHMRLTPERPYAIWRVRPAG